MLLHLVVYHDEKIKIVNGSGLCVIYKVRTIEYYTFKKIVLMVEYYTLKKIVCMVEYYTFYIFCAQRYAKVSRYFGHLLIYFCAPSQLDISVLKDSRYFGCLTRYFGCQMIVGTTRYFGCQMILGTNS